ncbi:MAG TPA: cold shock domain-containing protein [Proteiniphilum sp.]|nr:cold shock domain-containing protein [Dysgonomonadaceae bacterium zrk40]HOO95484.1 cold shock domain-containing protein [Proteiniphilum sp.]HPD87806.1 cold shock domain-containing protein [Proteiniphilum sp.]HPJ50382.1 cold shock domain-containing protein [Proteiniphilum sp.]
MARSNSFNKREIEKQKQQKKKEKLKKKEERKQQGTNSFEDMIAYVDANGVIIDTPPEPIQEEEKIELEDIEISVPRKEVSEEAGDPEGRVDFYDETRGFGFIREGNSVIKYFFHKSNAEHGIAEGDLVTYRLERGPKGMNAVDVKIIQ